MFHLLQTKHVHILKCVEVGQVQYFIRKAAVAMADRGPTCGDLACQYLDVSTGSGSQIKREIEHKE